MIQIQACDGRSPEVLKTIDEWRAVRGLKKLPEDWLPQTCFVASFTPFGFALKPVAFCSVNLGVGTSRMIIDDLHVDPNATRELRGECVDELVQVLVGVGKDMGKKYIDVFTHVQAVGERAMRHGFAAIADLKYIRCQLAL